MSKYGVTPQLPYIARYWRKDERTEIDVMYDEVELKAGNVTHASLQAERLLAHDTDDIQLFEVGRFDDQDGFAMAERFVGEWSRGLGKWQWADEP